MADEVREGVPAEEIDINEIAAGPGRESKKVQFGDGMYCRLWGPMTLRDWFAGMALQGMMASETGAASYRLMITEDGRPATQSQGFCDNNARVAYAWADAMLKARQTSP
jgi:hypothetical protein